MNNDTASKLNKLLETKAAIKQAIIDKGVEVSDGEPFANYANKIAEIEGEGGGSNDNFLALRTSNHTNYSYLFYNYKGDSVEPFGLESWETSEVIDMRNMFNGCSSFVSLDLSNWDTNKVTNMASMFSGCTALETLDLRNFDTAGVQSMSYMFNSCSSLHTLRLDNCNKDTIDRLIGTIGFPTGLINEETRKIWANPEIIDSELIYALPEGWEFVDKDTGEIIVPEIPLYVPYEFYNNREITEVTTMVNNTHTDLDEMFYCCTSLTTINGIENWDTSNVTNMSSMFRSCDILETLDVSSFDTGNVNNMSGMFAHCHRLRTIEGLSNFDTSNVTNMNSMFECCCTNLEYLDLSNFDMSNVWETENMFDRCNKLKEIRLDNCSRDTINKIAGSKNFPTSLIDREKRKLYISESEAPDYAPTGWEFVNKDTNEVIERPEDIIYKEGQFRENWDITEVTTMVTSEHDNLEYMFFGCSSLQTINGIEEWDTSNVTNMNSMFKECWSLTSLDLSNFDTSRVENMNEMFNSCESLQELNISNFDMSNTWETSWMFDRCYDLRTLRLDNCSNDTIEKIINSEGFPTITIDDGYGYVTRKIYCQEANAEGLEAPENWVFVFVSVE